MRMGLERAGWNIKFANDISPEKLKMYQGQFPDAENHFALSDIHKLAPCQIPQDNMRPKVLANFILMHPNIDWTIRKMPNLPSRDSFLDSIIDRPEMTENGWWERERAEYLINQMQPLHKTKLQEMMEREAR